MSDELRIPLHNPKAYEIGLKILADADGPLSYDEFARRLHTANVSGDGRRMLNNLCARGAAVKLPAHQHRTDLPATYKHVYALAPNMAVDQSEPPTCGECQHWSPCSVVVENILNDELVGHCRRYPPPIGPLVSHPQGGTDDSRWRYWRHPITRCDDWCGEFKERRDG